MRASKGEWTILGGISGTGVAQYIKGASGLDYDAIYNGTDEMEALQML